MVLPQLGAPHRDGTGAEQHCGIPSAEAGQRQPDTRSAPARALASARQVGYQKTEFDSANTGAKRQTSTDRGAGQHQRCRHSPAHFQRDVDRGLVRHRNNWSWRAPRVRGEHGRDVEPDAQHEQSADGYNIAPSGFGEVFPGASAQAGRGPNRRQPRLGA